MAETKMTREEEKKILATVIATELGAFLAEHRPEIVKRAMEKVRAIRKEMEESSKKDA